MHPRIVVLVPAHKEQDGITATLRGLLAQDIELHKIVVIANTRADQLEDDTAEIAKRFPNVEVIEHTGNGYMKAGAMNWGWFKHGRDADYIFTMDADTTVFPDTIRSMYEEFQGRRNKNVGAVCARYWAQRGSGLAWRLQRTEYSRYDDARQLRGWRVQVASGAAAMYRAEAIEEVLEHYDKTAPWDGTSLIEDYALTLDMRSLGWKTRAAKNAHVLTDTPQTFRELWKQRLRWGRGGVDEVRRRGWKRYLLPDIFGYFLFAIGMLGRFAFLTYLFLMLYYGMTYQLSWIGAVPIAVMLLARFTSFLRMNGKQAVDYLIVLSLVIEDAYGLWLEACSLVSIVKSFRSSSQAW